MSNVKDALTLTGYAREPFKAIPPESEHFKRIDGFARALFTTGMKAIRDHELKCSPGTLSLLESIESCVKNYPKESGSAFAQEGAAILSQLKAGYRE